MTTRITHFRLVLLVHAVTTPLPWNLVAISPVRSTAHIHDTEILAYLTSKSRRDGDLLLLSGYKLHGRLHGRQYRLAAVTQEHVDLQVQASAWPKHLVEIRESES